MKKLTNPKYCNNEFLSHDIIAIMYLQEVPREVKG